MQKSRLTLSTVLATVAAAGALIVVLGNAEPKAVLTGTSAFASYATEKPGTWRKITAADLPKPFATPSANNRAMIVPRPADAWPQALPGFKVELFASGLDTPREIRTAPNGDLFVMESNKGEILIFRGMTPDGKPKEHSVFATGLRQSFGMAFYPPGNNPQYVYAANTDSVVRFPYKSGDLKAGGPAETIITGLPRGGHWTRDLAFSPDGKRLFVSVGSGSNIDDPATHPGEKGRAAIREYTPDGKFVKLYATGIRNPVGIAINPTTGELWCSTNERDGLGDNLVPDYITHVQEGRFYGWPYYYMGSNPDPRLPAHPELKGKVIVPDVLLQPHNASLELTFYEGSQFPAEYKGDIFAAEHGSWNKARRAGYEVIRVPLKDGHAVSGAYEDFLTGFVTPSGEVWGRPVGVATAADGSLMVTDDGSNSIWRVSYTGH